MNTILQELKNILPDLVGNINIKKIDNMILMSGNLFTTNKNKAGLELTNIINNKYPQCLISSSIKFNELTVSEEEIIETNNPKEKILDELNIVYYGTMNTNFIKKNTKFKNKNIIHHRDKIDKCMKVLNFVSPIILNSKLEIIDGNKRLEVAEDNGIKEVMVVIIDDAGIKADALRLILNRTSEFQKWDWYEVDDYVDSVPQAQPILEPLGFFGKNILPTSYFSNSVLEYTIDPFNEKQKQYSQEKGLAEWAKYRKEQMKKESDWKRSKKPKKLEGAISLFDLTPKEEDFLETYDIEKETNKFLEKARDNAEILTNHCDEKKRQEILEKGGIWQTSHRTSEEVAKDKREVSIKYIESLENFNELQKTMIIQKIDDYAEAILKKDIEKIKEILANQLL